MTITYIGSFTTGKGKDTIKISFMFKNNEELEEFISKTQNTHKGFNLREENINFSEKVYKLICMKRRMKAKLEKKK